MYFHFLILYLIEKFKGDRSTSAVFHLLRGKRTAQTIQDGYTYGVHPYFNGLHTLAREEMDVVVNGLHKQGFVEEMGLNQCVLTPLGSIELARLQQIYELPEGLNGWQAGSNSDRFWLRLSLTIQVLSHLVHRDKHYVTITQNIEIQEWVKQFLFLTPYPKTEISRVLYQELISLLQSRPPLQQTLFTHRLSGFQKEGVTFEQLAFSLKKEKVELLIHLKAAIDSCVLKLQNERRDYPILSQMLDTQQHNKMTQSAKETFKWFKKGYSLEAIALRRRLKESTIQDHFIEMARVEPQKMAEQFLPEDLEDLILTVLDHNPTRRLSELKKVLPEEVSYFQLRLALVLKEERVDA